VVVQGLLAQLEPHLQMVLAALVVLELLPAFLALVSLTLEAVAVLHTTLERLVLAGQVVAAIVEQAEAQLVYRELQIVVAVAALVVMNKLVLAALAVPALSSCPTPCQKAQSLNFCLLRHGKHQQALLPLITWWWLVAAVVLVVLLAAAAVALVDS
jgi:hypothetical protein